jgi:hypothetical protein
MTKRYCPSERAFRDWRISFYRKHIDSSLKQKGLLCRNDKTPLSFWRSFSRLKNLFLSKAHRFLVEAKSFSVGMTFRFLLSSEWQNATVILKELFATEESVPFEKLQIPRQGKTASLSEWHWDCSSKQKNFSVGMTLRFLLSSEWQNATVILKEPFRDWRIYPCQKTKDSSSKQKASLSEWHWDSSSKQKVYHKKSCLFRAAFFMINF